MDHNNDREDEWETDSIDSQREVKLDHDYQEKRKHINLRNDENASKRRASASWGASDEPGPSSQNSEIKPDTKNDVSTIMPEVESIADADPDLDEPPHLESNSEDSDEVDDWQDGSAMHTSDEEEPEITETDATVDCVFGREPTDPQSLVSPLPSIASHLSIPAYLLTREFSGLSGYTDLAFIRQKLTGHRDMVQRLGLWAKLEHHTGCVNALNFNPSGTLLASGSDDLNIGIWDWSKKILKYSFPSGHYANVFQNKFMPLSNDSLIVTAARDGAVRLAEMSSAGGLPTTKALCRHQGSCHKIDVRADAMHNILTCAEDAAVFNIDIREAKAKKSLVVVEKGEKVPLYSIMSNPQKATQFVVAGYDRFVRVYDLRFLTQDSPRNADPVLKLCPPFIRNSENTFSVSSAVFNFTGSEILASYNDHNVFLFKNGADEKACSIPVQEYEGHRNNQTVKGVNFHGPCSEYVVSGSDCGKVFFWDKATARVLHFLEADGIGAVNVLESHPTDPIFATSGLEHSVKIWTPTAQTKADLQELIPVIEKNHAERKRDNRRQRRHEIDEGQFLMMFMEHLQRRRLGRARQQSPSLQPGVDPGQMPHLEDNNDDSDDDLGLPGLPNCAMS